VSLVLIILAAIFPVKVTAAFISEQQPDIHLIASWLNPLLKIVVTRLEGHTLLTVQLFNRKVYSKDFSKDASNLKIKTIHITDYINKLKAFKIKGIKLFATYGFIDPSVTGMLFGIIDIVTQAIGFEEYYNNADFAADSSYFNITAEAKVNAAASILQLFHNKLFYSHNNTLNGTIKK
jgi:hypothetical protein